MDRDGPQVAPREPKRAPRWPAEGPRVPQAGPKRAQDEAKMAPHVIRSGKIVEVEAKKAQIPKRIKALAKS